MERRDCNVTAVVSGPDAAVTLCPALPHVGRTGRETGHLSRGRMAAHPGGCGADLSVGWRAGWAVRTSESLSKMPKKSFTLESVWKGQHVPHSGFNVSLKEEGKLIESYRETKK